MSTRSYKITGLDCAEEVAILKRVVGPLAGGEDRLTFNLLDGRMNVDCTACGDIGSAIVESVGKTGMRAVPWGDHTGAAL
ncbi:MAG: cation-transporting P-type ATPase, partial [Bdellovibrionota bacterium]